MKGCDRMGNRPERHQGGGYDPDCTCRKCMAKTREIVRGGGSPGATSFRDVPQRDDPSVTNTYFNAGQVDGDRHGHVKHRDNPDGTTDYLYARDVDGTEYDV